MEFCQPSELTVFARYTRRGGVGYIPLEYQRLSQTTINVWHVNRNSLSMTNLRWLSLFCFFIFRVDLPSNANTIYSSAILNEASSLVNIVPKQTKQLAKDYLVQRTLSSKTEHSPSVMAR